jgi:hypothetical protein
VSLAENPARAAAMGQFNARRIAERFTEDVMVEQTIGLYRRVLENVRPDHLLVGR